MCTGRTGLATRTGSSGARSCRRSACSGCTATTRTTRTRSPITLAERGEDVTEVTMRALFNTDARRDEVIERCARTSAAREFAVTNRKIQTGRPPGT